MICVAGHIHGAETPETRCLKKQQEAVLVRITEQGREKKQLFLDTALPMHGFFNTSYTDKREREKMITRLNTESLHSMTVIGLGIKVQ